MCQTNEGIGKKLIQGHTTSFIECPEGVDLLYLTFFDEALEGYEASFLLPVVLVGCLTLA